MLGEMTGNEAREACRNVVLLVSSLVMIGHVTLRPLVSIGGTPFQDPAFEIPEPIGGGMFITQNCEMPGQTWPHVKVQLWHLVCCM